MRVTFVTSGLETGGAEFALLRLLPALRASDIESSVVSLRSAGTVGPLLLAESVPVSELGMPAPGAVLFGLPRVVRTLREWRPSVLHGWMYHGNIAATMAALRARLPVVWGIRQSLGLGTRDKWLTQRVIQAGALMSRHPALIVYNSAAAREQHERRGYAPDTGAVVPNGFDTDRLRPDGLQRLAVRRALGIDQGVLVVAKVARFHPAKDYPTFLRAAARCRDRFPDAMFLMIGEGINASNRELGKLISSLDLGNNVRLLGRRDDVARLMAAFDVLCLTSSGMEGFPNVVGEAMSCGVPCVGTAVGDVTELIGDTGEVVSPGDPEAVAAALGRLLALEPAERRELGEHARQRIINHFSLGEVARKYAELLFSVVDRRS